MLNFTSHVCLCECIKGLQDSSQNLSVAKLIATTAQIHISLARIYPNYIHRVIYLLLPYHNTRQYV